MQFATALENQYHLRTANDMRAESSSRDLLVDLFYKIGASRGGNILKDFEAAYLVDPETAIRVALWARDIREGAGERKVFRDILLWLESKDPTFLSLIIPRIPEFGRWDDLLVFNTSEFKAVAFVEIKKALNEENGLCAKWMPRKGPIAVKLRKFLGLNPKQYRLLLVRLTKVVETQMCAKDWERINFSHVPSLAMSRYNKAFLRNAPNSFSAYRESLKKGTTKINAAAVYPYDVIKSIRIDSDPEVALAQWDALPNYVSNASILPLVDVSGSMTCGFSNSNLTPLTIAVSLGLYLADKNKGAFKDVFMTFSHNPSLQVLRGNLLQKLSQMKSAGWEMNTNLHAALDNILHFARDNRIVQEEMPNTLLILSDMQFDSCVEHDDSAIEMIDRKYKQAGYLLPSVVFWNLNAKYRNLPILSSTKGTALISGFSPAILKSVLAAEDLTPQKVMWQTIGNPRYDFY